MLLHKAPTLICCHSVPRMGEECISPQKVIFMQNRPIQIPSAVWLPALFFL